MKLTGLTGRHPGNLAVEQREALERQRREFEAWRHLNQLEFELSWPFPVLPRWQAGSAESRSASGTV